MKKNDRALVEPAARARFADGIDLDEAMRPEQPNGYRWDYVLSDIAGGELIGMEPHPAETGEVSVVIAKKRAAATYLRDHLRPGKRIGRWLWVTAGKQTFPANGRERLRLAQAGIAFTGRRVRAKDLG